jgi:hypothetical protein
LLTAISWGLPPRFGGPSPQNSRPTLAGIAEKDFPMSAA